MVSWFHRRHQLLPAFKAVSVYLTCLDCRHHANWTQRTGPTFQEFPELQRMGQAWWGKIATTASMMCLYVLMMGATSCLDRVVHAFPVADTPPTICPCVDIFHADFRQRGAACSTKMSDESCEFCTAWWTSAESEESVHNCDRIVVTRLVWLVDLAVASLACLNVCCRPHSQTCLFPMKCVSGTFQFTRTLCAAVILPTSKRRLSFRQKRTMRFASGDEFPEQTRRAIIRIHTNLGHPQNSTLAKMITDAGGSEELIKCATRYQCSVCKRMSQPRLRRLVSVPRTRQFNDTLLADVHF